jgi:Ca2+-binding RTX toxin-like protein
LKKIKWTGTQASDYHVATTQQTSLYGLGGNDELYASYVSTKMFGGDGRDTLIGNRGNDTISGGGGNDEIMGNSGNDIVLAQGGDDFVDGGLGNDGIDGGLGADSLDGQGGIDLLRGGAGNDSLSGGSGNDALIGGYGADEMLGGSGSDIFIIEWNRNFTGNQVDTIGEGYAPGLDRFEVGADEIHLANIPGLSDIDDITIRQVSDTYINPATGNPVLTVHDQILFNGVVLVNVWTDQLSKGDISLE